MFTDDNHNREFLSLSCLPKNITGENNDMLCEFPTMQELKKTIFATSSNSSPGPGGMLGMFYHHCCDIIAEELYRMVLEFFNGGIISRAISHLCLILLSKVRSSQEFSKLRSISLSNFSVRFLSKFINSRLTTILSKIISQNHTDFIKGRSITENITLTRETVTI